MPTVKKVIFVAPMFNASSHLDDLVESLKEQNNTNWELIIIDDMSNDNSWEKCLQLSESDERITVRKNKEKCWALKNVISTSREFENRDDIVIANIDGDDALCNENTVGILLKAYEDEVDAVWTSHSWDINGMNISRSMPNGINPYQCAWVSSHLKTWRASILKNISDDNFKDLSGNWFKRGYDQALYLPILYKSRKRKHLDEICYLYRINSKSVPNRLPEMGQLNTVKLVRARGFVG